MRSIASIIVFAVIFSVGCESRKREEMQDGEKANGKNAITIEILRKEVESIIEKDAEVKTIARGFNWAEGPVWIKDQQALLFSDVPENKIYRWSENDGLTIWLEPSGYTGSKEWKREGSNGLLLNEKDQLILCQHGDRRIAIMDSPIAQPIPKFITVADNWRSKRLNSPNDAAFYKDELFFTDPPYGLPDQDQDQEKELGINGVFRITPGGMVILIENALTRPNGIAFDPDKNIMYVSNSDPGKAIWMKYDITDKNHPAGKVLFDATDQVLKFNGLPDGLKVHPSGYLFATGPGGIWIFSPDEKLSARIYIPQATANCAFDDSYSHLYVAADSTIIRIALIAESPNK